MIVNYTPVPDLTAGREMSGQERDLFDWLRDTCEWREGEKGDLQAIVEAYRERERQRHNIDCSPRGIIWTLRALGYIVAAPNLIGIFLRSKDAKVAVTPIDRSHHGVASITPDLIQANNQSRQSRRL